MHMKIIAAYLSTGIVFLIIDAIWLSAMANVLYRPTLGDMLAPDFRLAPAVAFYFIYIAALLFFAVLPSLEPGKGIGTALFYGAAFGFAAYATYDLTNQATLKNWTTTLTIADLIWGSTLSAISAAAGHWITAKFVG